MKPSSASHGGQLATITIAAIGVVHGDITPGNILLDGEERPHLDPLILGERGPLREAQGQGRAELRLGVERGSLGIERDGGNRRCR